MELVNYQNTLEEIKGRIYQAQNRAMRVVSKELVSLYWEIGKTITEKTKKEGWGRSTVQKLAKDLDVEFPGIRGFSQRNIWRMKEFYTEYCDSEFLPTVLTEIGWSQNLLIVNPKTKQLLNILSKEWGNRSEFLHIADMIHSKNFQKKFLNIFQRKKKLLRSWHELFKKFTCDKLLIINLLQ